MSGLQNLTSEQLLIMKTAQLRRAAPEAWAEFSSALQNYTGQQLHELAGASIERLQVAQGRVQSLMQLLKTFENSLAMAEKIYENRK